MQSRYFKRSEFSCRCGCGFDEVDEGLVAKLDAIREKMGSPLAITSGCRCDRYNRKVGGVPDSTHRRGKAADIAVRGSQERHRLVCHALAAGIKRIGIGRSFVHIDVDDSLPTEVMWVYT